MLINFHEVIIGVDVIYYLVIKLFSFCLATCGGHLDYKLDCLIFYNQVQLVDLL